MYACNSLAYNMAAVTMATTRRRIRMNRATPNAITIAWRSPYEGAEEDPVEKYMTGTGHSSGETQPTDEGCMCVYIPGVRV